MSETKKNETIKWGDSVEAILATLTPAQKVVLLGKYIDSKPELSRHFDELLIKFASSDHHVMLEFKSEIEKEGKGKFTLGNKTSKEVVTERLTTLIALEYKKFWAIEEAQRPPTLGSKINDPNTKKLVSYIPKLVQRRLALLSQGIKVPEMEKFSACVMFADISGFTPLTEKFASEGSEGVEKLTTVLNDYFDKFIKIIYEYGGDIVKFAGDALLVVWPTTNKSGLEGMVMLGCQAAKKLLDELNDYAVEKTDLKLRLHIGIGAGECGGVYVGGAYDVIDSTEKVKKKHGTERIEYFISGDVLEQVSSCEKQAQPGECYISEFAMERVSNLNALETRQKGKGGFENHKLVDIKIWAPSPPKFDLPFTPEISQAVRNFINLGVLRHIDSGTRKWMAELRKISVIFVNLTSPFKESKLDQLQNAVKGMQAIVYSFEGTVRQFMIDDKGSVFIASYGVPPLSHEDDAVRAVETGLAIKAFLEQEGVAHSIGVTTGTAFCGDVGTETRREYAMVGDIVNLSARLMVAAMSRKGLLICNDTYNASKSSSTLSFEKQDPFKVKGKSNPITTYVPLKVKKRPAETVSGAITIIGREKEIENLQELTTSIVQEKKKNVQILIIEGEVGVGKTILGHKLGGYFKEANKRIFSGHGDQLKATSQYHAFEDIFDTMVNPQSGEFLPEYASLLQAEKKFVPLLKSVFNLNKFDNETIEENDTTRAMSSQVRSKETQRLILLLLSQVFKPGCVIILDNAHWLDSGSWSLALAISNELKRSILLTLIMRPLSEKTNFSYSQIIRSHHATQMILKDLSEEDTADLITQCIQADLARLNRTDVVLKKIPTKITQQIHTKSNGNPYSTVEMVSALLESGTLSISKNGNCILNNETWSDKIPHTLAGLLTSKVDKLSPTQQLILKVGSVIRGEFSVDMLFEILINQSGTGGQTVVMFKQDELKRDLRAIETSGLIQAAEQENYVFSNPLIIDVVYELMLHQQRRSIHEQIASYYASHYPGNSHYYSLLAYHYKQAAMDHKALESFEMAGKSCLAVYANAEAVAFFSEALQLLGKTEDSNSSSLERISMERKLGQAYFNLGRFVKASEHFVNCLNLLDLPIKELSKLVKKKYDSFLFYHGKPKREEVEEIKHDRMHRKREAVISLLALSKISYYSSKKQEAILLSNLACILSEGTGAALESESDSISALMIGLNGENAKAEEFFSKARERAGNQIDSLKIVEETAGIYFCGINKWSNAQESITKALENAKTVGDLKSFEEAGFYLATTYAFQGDFKKSTSFINESLDSAQKRGDAHSIIMGTNMQARNFYLTGDFVNCVKALEEVQIGIDSGDNDDASIAINYFALNSLIHLRKFKTDEKKPGTVDSEHPVRQFWSFSEEVFSTLSVLDPTRFDLFFAYTWLLEGYARITQEPSLLNYLTDLKITKSKIQERVKKSFKNLERFVGVFPFAEPRLFMWKAYFNFLSANPNKAKQNFTKSLEKAKELNLKLEEAFTLYARFRFFKSEEDRAAAIAIFPEVIHFDTDISNQSFRHRCSHSPSLANFFANSSAIEAVRSPRSTLTPKDTTPNKTKDRSESTE